MKFYGKDISLYAPDSGRLNQPNSTHFIKVSQTEAALGHFSAVDGTTPTAGIYFNAYSNNDSSIISPGTLNVTTNTTNNLNVTTGSLQLKAQSTASMISFGASTDSNVIQYNNQSLTSTFDTNYTVSANSISLNGAPKASGFNLKLDANSMTLGKTGDTVYLKSVNTNAAELYANSGLTLKTNNTELKLDSNGGQVTIDGSTSNYLHIIPSGTTGTFYLNSGSGSIWSEHDSSGYKKVYISPKLEVKGNIYAGSGGDVGADGNIFTANGNVSTTNGTISGQYLNIQNNALAVGSDGKVTTSGVLKVGGNMSVGGNLYMDNSSVIYAYHGLYVGNFPISEDWCNSINSSLAKFNSHTHSFTLPSGYVTVRPAGWDVSSGVTVTFYHTSYLDDGSAVTVSTNSLPDGYSIKSITLNNAIKNNSPISGTSSTPN
jgi:hypothetical protein